MKKDYNLVLTVDLYDMYFSEGMLYIYPNGETENIRNRDMFPSFNIFNQIGSRDAVDFDLYVVPKNSPLALYKTDFNKEKKEYTTEIRLNKQAHSLKDLIEEKRQKNLEKEEYTEKITYILEDSTFEATEKDLDEANNNFSFKEYLENFLIKAEEKLCSKDFKNLIEKESKS